MRRGFVDALRTVAAPVFVGLFFVLSGPAIASERVACVQSQLALLGCDVGTVDGKIQTKTRAATRSAFRDLGAEAQLTLPFDDRRAGRWCRELGLFNPDLQAAWPSQNPIVIYTDQSDTAIKQAVLSQAEAIARQFFVDQFDVKLSGSFALLGTDDPEYINTLLVTALSDRGVRPRKTPLDYEKICKRRRIGAVANRNFVAMCWRKPDLYDAAWAQQIMPHLTAILVHEFMHQAQYELATDIPVRRLASNKDWLLGPSWMVEGSAEVIEELFRNPIIQSGDGKSLFQMQKPARSARVVLDELNQSGSVNTARGYGTARYAAYVLAQKFGVQSLFDYFQALGETEDRDAAFQRVFGQSLASFEDEFEGLRREFGTARAYIRNRSQ
jgi:hypothetical protein